MRQQGGACFYLPRPGVCPVRPRPDIQAMLDQWWSPGTSASCCGLYG